MMTAMEGNSFSSRRIIASRWSERRTLADDVFVKRLEMERKFYVHLS